jgi:hypothetical protein
MTIGKLDSVEGQKKRTLHDIEVLNEGSFFLLLLSCKIDLTSDLKLTSERTVC